MMGRLRPTTWLVLAFPAMLTLGFIYFVGLAAMGKDLDDRCAAAGQPLDRGYLDQHWQDSGRFFPLHDRCNATYDLVPGWINPTLGILAAATVMCLVGFAVSLMTRLTRNAA